MKSTHELSSTYILPSQPRLQDEESGHVEQHAELLAPADSGKSAWLFLFGVFLFEAIIWGMPYSFGVFQDYYSSHPPISNAPQGIPTIGTTSLGVMYLPAPLLSLAMQRYPIARKPCMVIGLAVVAAALIAASFCDSVPGLIATQGVLYALGGILAYFPGMQIIDEWFIKRRATAFAIVWAGAPLSGCVLPFVFQWLLDSYGFRTTLRVYAVVVIVVLGSTLAFIKPRSPITRSKSPAPILSTTNFAFLTSSSFWWYFIGTFGQSLGFFPPSLWMPTFARDYHFPAFAGPLSLALYNISAFGGTVAQGWLVDHYHVSLTLAASTLVSAISVFVLWGLGTLQPLFYLFAIFWGVSAGAYNATWAGYAFDLKAEGFHVDTTFLITLMVVAKGVACLASGPLSEALHGLRLGSDVGFAYQGTYGAIIVYTGVCSLLGGIACLKRFCK